MRVREGLCALVLAVACTACTSYMVQQSSLVAAPVSPPPATDRGLVDAYVGDASLTFVSRPRRAKGNDSGLWVARHLLQGALTLHLSPLIAFRITGVSGLHEGALRAAPGGLPNPGRDVNGYGTGVSVGVPLGAHRLLLTADLTTLSVPSYVVVSCIDTCEEDAIDVVEGRRRDSVLQASSSLGYAYRSSEMLLFSALIVLQNHPTNRESFASSDAGAEVQAGPLYTTLALGVEFSPWSWLSVIPTLQWPLTRSPIEYGPIVGIGLRALAFRPLLGD